MVFIHGGGFFFGSSNLYGPTYIMEEEVVLVSMNYRLGPFGKSFLVLYLSSLVLVVVVEFAK
jgi:carboxylesterase type B